MTNAQRPTLAFASGFCCIVGTRSFVIHWSLVIGHRLSLPSFGRPEEISATQAHAPHLAGEAAILLLPFVEERGVGVIEILQLDAIDFLPDEPLDRGHR